MEVLIGVGSGLAVIGLAGLFRWVFKRFSLKTKNDEAVAEIRKKLAEIDKRCEARGYDLKCATAMQSQVEEVHAAIQPLVKAVFGLLLKAKEGKVNGEIEEALRAVKDYLGI
jgi:hypothetical protein